MRLIIDIDAGLGEDTKDIESEILHGILESLSDPPEGFDVFNLSQDEDEDPEGADFVDPDTIYYIASRKV